MADPRDEPRTFLVECFAGSADEIAVAGARDRMGSACAALQAKGVAIEYLGAILVPQDELVWHIVASLDVDEVRTASRRAALRVERIVESVAIGMPPGGAVLVPRQPLRTTMARFAPEEHAGRGDLSPRG